MTETPRIQQVLVLDRQVPRSNNSHPQLVGRRIRMIVRLHERLKIKGGIVPPLRDELDGALDVLRLALFR